MRGSRKPRFRLVPPARDRSAGRQAIELARSIDLVLDAWQQDVLLAGMGRDRAGRWVCDEVVEIVPRQNGKSVGLMVRALWGVVEGGEELVLFSAHQQRTSYESFLALVSWCEHPALARLTPKVNRGRGNEAVSIGTGRIVFISRSRSSGRGFSPDTVILDEAFALDDVAMGALKPSMSARTAPQTWYASSAPHPDSTVLRRMALAGRAGELERTAFMEWSCPEDADPEDRKAWAMANPALGVRLTERYTLSELASMSAEDFARERLGIWHEEDVVSVFPRGAWQACESLTARPPEDARTAVAVDVSPSRDRATVGAAGLLEDGRCLVQLLETGAGVDWTVPFVAQLVRRHKPGAVVVDGMLGSVAAALEAADVEVTTTTASDMATACGGFYDGVMERRIVHLGQPELTAAVEGAKQRDIGDAAWAWSRRRSDVDITPLVACTLAAHGVASAKPATPVFIL